MNCNPSLGRNATLTKYEDKGMVAFITLMAKKFYEVTQHPLCKLAQYFAAAKIMKKKIFYQRNEWSGNVEFNKS